MLYKDGEKLPEIPMGTKVHPEFWGYRARLELLMLMILVNSFNSGYIDPMTGHRKCKIAMILNNN